MKVGGGGPPLIPIAIGGGVVIIIALIAYLVLQSGGNSTSGLTGPEKAEADTSSSIPGTYVPSQGRGHFPGVYSSSWVEQPFCPGVVWSGNPSPAAVSTPTPAPTGGAQNPGATPTVQTGCHDSNPPSSGEHLNVQNNVDMGNGIIIKLPPDPDVYPPSVEIPRDAIAHILEHAGVFLGYNCAANDSACDGVVEQIKTLVKDRIQAGDHIVMAHDNDLVAGTIGLSSWTRVYDFKYQDYSAKETQRFLDTNSCRYDPEGFCH